VPENDVSIFQDETDAGDGKVGAHFFGSIETKRPLILFRDVPPLALCAHGGDRR
jgi:hypothetical protein